MCNVFTSSLLTCEFFLLLVVESGCIDCDKLGTKISGVSAAFNGFLFTASTEPAMSRANLLSLLVGCPMLVIRRGLNTLASVPILDPVRCIGLLNADRVGFIARFSSDKTSARSDFNVEMRSDLTSSAPLSTDERFSTGPASSSDDPPIFIDCVCLLWANTLS